METKANGRSLPKGWQWVKLGDVCDFTYGESLPARVRRFDGKVSVYGSNGIVGYHDQAVTSGPTIIIGRKGSIGEVHLSEVGCFPIDTTYYIEHTKLEADLTWLFYCLKYLKLQNLNRAAAVPGLNRDDAYALDVPFPPLDEQRRIASRLNEQLAAVESARKAAEEQLRAARQLRSAYLREVFEGQHARQWHKQLLAEVGEIASGITLGRKLHGVETRKVRYLRVANVKDGYLDLSDIYKIDATKADIEKCTLKYGDLLLTEGGDPDKLGRGTFWEEQIPECLHQNHIFRVRFDLDKFFPQFVSYQVGSSYGKEYFLAHAKQTTGIATINQKVLGNFPLLIPPFDEQKQIAETLKSKIADADKLSASLESRLDEINRLPASLLREAFAGQA